MLHYIIFPRGACEPPACAVRRADGRHDAVSAAEAAWAGESRGHRNADSAYCPSRGTRSAPARLHRIHGRFWPHAAYAAVQRPRLGGCSRQQPQEKRPSSVSSLAQSFHWIVIISQTAIRGQNRMRSVTVKPRNDVHLAFLARCRCGLAYSKRSRLSTAPPPFLRAQSRIWSSDIWTGRPEGSK